MKYRNFKPDSKLKEWLIEQKSKGYRKDQLKKVMIDKGYPPETAENSLKEVFASRRRFYLLTALGLLLIYSAIMALLLMPQTNEIKSCQDLQNMQPLKDYEFKHH